MTKYVPSRKKLISVFPPKGWRDLGHRHPLQLHPLDKGCQWTELLGFFFCINFLYFCGMFSFPILFCNYMLHVVNTICPFLYFIILMLIVWEQRSFWSSASLIGFEWAVCDLYKIWNSDLRVYHHNFFIWNVNILFPTVSTIGSSNYIYMLQVFKNGNFNLNVFKVKYSWPIRPVFPYLWFDHCIFEYQVHDLMNCGLS